MKASSIALILVSIALSSTAQIALKAGMTDQKIIGLLSDRSYVDAAYNIAVSGWVILGLLLFASSVALWLFVLSSVPLSTAYPFVALGICLTTAAGNLLFHEPIALLKLLGTALIVAGIVCVAVSG